MPTALRDKPTWRRQLAEYGLTIGWLARQTGKSISSVDSYSSGRRKPSAEWVALAESVIAEHERTAA